MPCGITMSFSPSSKLTTRALNSNHCCVLYMMFKKLIYTYMFSLGTLTYLQTRHIGELYFEIECGWVFIIFPFLFKTKRTTNISFKKEQFKESNPIHLFFVHNRCLEAAKILLSSLYIHRKKIKICFAIESNITSEFVNLLVGNMVDSGFLIIRINCNI